jgi:hypothetical protein
MKYAIMRDRPLYAQDQDRGDPVQNDQETLIGIGPNSMRGFYFAIRGNVNTEQILKENPNAYVKVTIVKKPGK